MNRSAVPILFEYINANVTMESRCELALTQHRESCEAIDRIDCKCSQIDNGSSD